MNLGQNGGPEVRSYLPPAEVLEAARFQASWQADVVPLPWRLEEDPEARPGMVVVMAGPLILCSDVQRRPSAESEEIASALLRELEAAVGLVGGWPEAVVVRYPQVAFHLRLAVEAHGARLSVAPNLPELDEMASGLFSQVEEGLPGRPHFSSPPTWAAWGLPEQMLEDLLAAAAQVYEAAPWDVVLESEGIVATLPGGGRWFVAVLGAVHEPFSVILYADEEDFRAGAVWGAPDTLAGALTDRFYAVHFGDRGRLPRAMQREFASRGWPVAAPEAYPCLLAVDTPAGGVSREDAVEIIAVLRSLANLVSRDGAELLADGWRDWCDPGSGVELTLMPPVLEAPGKNGTPGVPDLEEESSELTIPPVLEGMLTDEEQAELRGLIAREDPPTMDELNQFLVRSRDRYNTTSQDELGGLSPEQVHRLLRSDWSDPDGFFVLERSLPFEAYRETRIIRNAQVLLEALNREDGAPATARGNLNRAFVREMMERLEWPDTPCLDLVGTNRKVVNEGDLWELHSLRIGLQRAGLIRQRKGRWLPTRKGRALSSGKGAGELFADLFLDHFRSRREERAPWNAGAEEFRYGISFSLFALGRNGGEWRTPAELAEMVLLPFVRDAIPAWDDFDPVELQLEFELLHPLERFGLLEMEVVSKETLWKWDCRYRTTSLYGHFLRFNLG